MDSTISTLLNDDSAMRPSHPQRVRFVDIYDLSVAGPTFTDNTSLMVTEPRDGFAREGHGNGIRILFDRNLASETARELILYYADSLRIEPKQPMFPWQPDEYSRDELLELLETENPREGEMALRELRKRKGVTIEDLPF